MIAVDTSALMAIILEEPDGGVCQAALAADGDILISAVTVVEARVVAAGRKIEHRMSDLLNGLAIDVVPVTAATAGRVAEIYKRWGKGFHPAGLNLSDCFAYDVAREHGVKLLYIGNDFVRTDIGRVLER